MIIITQAPINNYAYTNFYNKNSYNKQFPPCYNDNYDNYDNFLESFMKISPYIYKWFSYKR